MFTYIKKVKIRAKDEEFFEIFFIYNCTTQLQYFNKKKLEKIYLFVREKSIWKIHTKNYTKKTDHKFSNAMFKSKLLSVLIGNMAPYVV